MTPERIAEIRAMLGAATPGPWHVAEDDNPNWKLRIDANSMSETGWPFVACIRSLRHDTADAALIAAAPTIIAELLAEVERRLPIRGKAWSEYTDAERDAAIEAYKNWCNSPLH